MTSGRRGGWAAGWQGVYAAALIGVLLLPVAVVVLFSFNDPRGRFNFAWQGFTLRSWADPCAAPGLCEALGLSLQVALASTALTTVLGTLLALALARHRFRGRTTISLLVVLPLGIPPLVLGSSLLALLLNLGASRGFWTIVAAHVMFTISFVVVTVKARLQGHDPALEEAAADLYASGWATLWKVTLPLALPGIAAAALLAFALSFDDFIITNFVAGDDVTFPLYVWGAAQRGIPPQVNVIATAMLTLAVATLLAATALHRRRSGKSGGDAGDGSPVAP